ncbi:hypothetical protein C8R46DRAFT_1236164 [Mycena filopes]|nr:hypothetical protein C8R46DRAFT_1236164 [Mycena filopes]
MNEAAALTLAVDEAKRAVAEAHNAPSPASVALAASEAKCTSLSAEICALAAVVELQHTEIAALRVECQQKERANSELQENRRVLELQRHDLELSQNPLTAAQRSLNRERSHLAAGHAKLAANTNTAIATLKRALSELETDKPRPQPASFSSALLTLTPSPSKRPRLADRMRHALPASDSPPSNDDSEIPKRRVFIARWKDDDGFGGARSEYQPWLGYEEHVKARRTSV